MSLIPVLSEAERGGVTSQFLLQQNIVVFLKCTVCVPKSAPYRKACFKAPKKLGSPFKNMFDLSLPSLLWISADRIYRDVSQEAYSFSWISWNEDRVT